jgi:hypothetical protein
MKSQKIVIISCLLLSLYSCEKSKGKHQLVYSDKELKLTLNDVHDSRCPEQSICFWEGNAAVKLKAEMNGDKHIFTLNTYGFNEYNRDTSFWGYHFELMDVSPYPKTWEKEKLKNYQVDVKVELE